MWQTVHVRFVSIGDIELANAVAVANSLPIACNALAGMLRATLEILSL
jgi:hypothetical protein